MQMVSSQARERARATVRSLVISRAAESSGGNQYGQVFPHALDHDEYQLNKSLFILRIVLRTMVRN